MDTAKLNDWLQIFGIFALVASLIFVGLQLKQEQDIAAFEAVDDAANRVHDIRALLTENADVWNRGCLGEELDVEERTVFANLYAAYDFYEYANYVRLSSEDLSIASNDMAANIAIRRFAINHWRFPALQEMRESRLAWRKLSKSNFDRTYELIYEEVMAELESGEPYPEIDVMWCGH